MKSRMEVLFIYMSVHNNKLSILSIPNGQSSHDYARVLDDMALPPMLTCEAMGLIDDVVFMDATLFRTWRVLCFSI